MSNPSSFVTTLAADAAAVVTSLVPSLHLAPVVQATIIGVAGLLTTAHLHLPKFLAGAKTSKVGTDLEALATDLFDAFMPTKTAPAQPLTNPTKPA